MIAESDWGPLADYGWQVATALLALLVAWLRNKGRNYGKVVQLLTEAIEVSEHAETTDTDTIRQLKVLIAAASGEGKEGKIIADAAQRAEASVKKGG